MKRWLIRLTVAFVLLLLLTVGGACALFTFLDIPREAPGVPRDAVSIDDTHTVSYLHAGDPAAPRIVYVHGSPGRATDWARYVVDPIAGFESLAIDRFGFGQSTPKGPEPSLREQARAIEPFLVERNGKWPILVGHSLGGTIICQAAIDYPDRVGGLVILAGALAPQLETVHWYQRAADFAFMPSLLPRDLTTSNRELMPLKAELSALSERLGEITCPVAIIHGKKDMLVPVANADFMREHFAREIVHEFSVLPDQNHFLPWTVESKVRESIRSLAARK
ncbi:MAG: alpha/beta hydrolase [Candidatus Hydrogenedentes bacterium]|nr:alpha/beta hydrolase [Candidatus Hydrogenedentota bacterium]